MWGGLWGKQGEDSVPGSGGQGGFTEEVTLVLNLQSLRSYWADGRDGVGSRTDVPGQKQKHPRAVSLEV